MGSLAIELDRVSKAYRLYPTPRHRALELLTFGDTDVSHRLLGAD
jgi:hypothetical protein